MDNKRFCYVSSLLIPIVGIGQPSQAKTFTTNNGYQISTPNGWITKLGPCDNKITTVFYCATGKNGHPVLPMVEVAVRPQEAMTMKKLVSYAPWMINGTFPGFHQISATYTPLNGVSALDIRGTYPRGGRTICVRELFAIRAGEAYVITTAYPDEKRTICEPLSKSVINSVQWR